MTERKSNHHHSKGKEKIPALTQYYNPETSKIYRMRLIQVTGINTGVGGIGVGALLMAPNGATEWSAVAGLYDEFRVMSVRLRLVPTQQGSVTVQNLFNVFCYDNDNTSNLTSLGNGLEYDTAWLIPGIWYANKATTSSKVWNRPLKGVDTAVPWVDVAAPTNSLGSIKYYVQGTASVHYYDAMVEYFVEFRGRI